MSLFSSHNKRKDGAGNAHGTAAYVYNSVKDFETLPFAVDPSGLSVTTLGQVKRTALLQNFPNPFNPETWLPYRLGTDATVTLRIYNVKGQLTRELDLGAQNTGGLSDPRNRGLLGRQRSRRRGRFQRRLFLHPAGWPIPSHTQNARFEIGLSIVITTKNFTCRAALFGLQWRILVRASLSVGNSDRIVSAIGIPLLIAISYCEQNCSYRWYVVDNIQASISILLVWRPTGRSLRM